MLPLRPLAPRPGRDYAVYDLGSAFWCLVFGSYLALRPSPSTSAALSWLLGAGPLMAFGIALNVAALTALACSYVPNAVPAGRAILLGACGIWSAILTLGWLAEAHPSIHADGIIRVVACALFTGAAVTVLARVRFPRQLDGYKYRSRLTDWGRGETAAHIAGATITVLLLGAALEFVGDPRQLGAAVIYGFLAHHAYRLQTTYAIVPKGGRPC